MFGSKSLLYILILKVKTLKYELYFHFTGKKISFQFSVLPILNSFSPGFMSRKVQKSPAEWGHLVVISYYASINI